MKNTFPGNHPGERSSAPSSSSLLYFPQTQEGGLKKGIHKISQVLRRQKWVVAVTFLLVLSAAAIYTFRQTSYYQAATLLLVDQEESNRDDALNFGFISDLSQQSMGTQILILEQSTAAAEQAAERLIELGTVPTTGKRISLLGPADASPSVTAVAKYLQDLVTVVPYESSAFRIVATSTDPHEAALLANTFAATSISYSQEASRYRVTQSRKFLEDRIAEGRSNLQESEQNLEEYMRREGGIALDQEVQSAVSSQARLDASLAEAQLELEIKEASLRATQQELRRVQPRIAQRMASGTTRELEAAQARLAELELRREQVFENYPELRANPSGDPRLASLQSQIENGQQRVAQLSEQYVQEALSTGGRDPNNPESSVSYAAELERQLANDRIAMSGLETRIATTRRQMGDYYSRLQNAPKQSVKLAQLQRDRAAKEQLFLYLQSKLQEAMIAEDSEIGSVRLLREADVPTFPVYPRRGRTLLLASLLGLLLGIGMAAFRDKLDGRLYTPEDVQRKGLHLLSVVPDMDRFLKQSFDGKPSLLVNERDVSTNMVALLAPYSAMAEAYRHLYTRIQFSQPDRVVKSILVTSPEAGAGKTTTALNLALTTARANRRTIIVDADMRRPAVRRYLGLSGGLALDELLTQPGAIERLPEHIEEAATGVENLYALTVKKPVADPLEYLTSSRMHELVRTLRTSFDTIIFDSPPLLLASDATLLSSLCDATILVASAGYTDSEALEQIDDELEEAGARIVGVVLNRFDPTDPGSRNTYGYRQQHYADYHQSEAN